MAVVGVGIRAPAQTTLEARGRIEQAEKVYALPANAFTEYWLHRLNDNVETLVDLYAVGKDRRQTYLEMVERIVGAVRKGLRVCVASYGHPGVFAYPFHEAIRRLRKEGFPAEMLAGVSAEDCLIADLGVDPASAGWRSYEATDFLIYRRALDPASGLILWQVGVIGHLGYETEDDRPWNSDGVLVLTERLLEGYRRDHEVIVYEAAQLPICKPKIDRVLLQDLPAAPITVRSTLYVPPMTEPVLDAAMVERLRLSQPVEAVAAGSCTG